MYSIQQIKSQIKPKTRSPEGQNILGLLYTFTMDIEVNSIAETDVAEIKNETSTESAKTSDSTNQTEKEDNLTVETVKKELSEEADKADALVAMPLETAKNAEKATGESFSEEKTKLEELKNELKSGGKETSDNYEKVSEIHESSGSEEKSPEKVGAQRLTEFVTDNMDRMKDVDMKATYGFLTISRINKLSGKAFAEAATSPALEKTNNGIQNESSDLNNEDETELFKNSIMTMGRATRELRGGDPETHRDELVEEKANIAEAVVKNLNKHGNKDGCSVIAFAFGTKSDELGRATAEKVTPHLEKIAQETMAMMVGVRKEPEDKKVLESMAPYLDEDVKKVLDVE